jgi:hypothetical protein
MQKATTYDLPAAGSAPVVVRCTQVTRRMLVQESGVAADFQGITMALLTPNGFGKYMVGDEFTIPPSELLEPYLIAGAALDHDPHGFPIGNGGSYPDPVSPGGPVTQGTVVFQATSATATPTKIVVTEWN